MRHDLIAIAVLALTACSPAPDKPDANEAPAVATPAGQTPEAFVRSLYEEGDTRPDASGRPSERPMWSARTQALLAESDRLTPEGDIGFFEADPICDCQDGAPVLRSVTATSTAPDRADVAVVQGFAEPGNAVHRKTYNLVREGGQWRVDDQHYQSMGEVPYAPMVQRLEAWIAEARPQAGT